MNNHLTFITGNASKAEQLSRYLGVPVNHVKVDLIEIQSVDLSEVVEHKVKEAYQHTQTPVIVDDVGLTIARLGKLPGPFIKFFISELGNEGICQLLREKDDRAAVATVAIGYYYGTQVQVFLGNVAGTIAAEPHGSGGFGWDAIFIPQGYSQTRAAMSEEDYDATSPRKLALEQLENFLKSK